MYGDETEQAAVKRAQAERAEKQWWVKLITVTLTLGTAAILLSMWLTPKYSVYSSRMAGEALLAHAQAAKEVVVAEAKAKKESAALLADAEVSRAEGVAKANNIIGESLKGNDAYLRYLWITEVACVGVNKTVVYVPTEGNLPVLEAGRFGEPK